MEHLEGKNLVSCFDVVNQTWREVELMAERLTSILTKELDTNRLRISTNRISEEPDLAEFDDNYSDVSIGLIKCIPVKTKGKKAPDLYFGFQVSLAGNLIAVPGNEEPIVYMMMSTEEFGFDHWWLAFPLCKEEDDLKIEVENDVLLRWKNDGSVAYGVKLLSLKNEHDLLDLCVKPLMSLHNGNSAKSVFGDHPDQRFVRFPDKSMLIA
ncbi:hypothetical protein [Acidithiobacillus caldus]|uniref:Uncharacterized protein n=1 Tax=Acidithiobacillus caldus TaxID=33059 RepID=A0A1E7YQG2_9PROT|nr:hypothetical protein [Acidithiobacillus caldus]OFC34840.1 hypothetical protein BAE28_11965 [Acidithiobacillus caldus]OFC38652.1 hypothetical protein BAE27_01680 [Acidithiobacillus caldus]OFC41971.1 hypothetical protein BAE29_01215 [Acidithiobacillus caldus]